MSPAVEHRTKRWQEQRWLLDAVIQFIGPEWDEGRLNGQVVVQRRVRVRASSH